METSKTINLNVGGTTYEVSRSLIEAYPHSMLARLVSDTWQQETKSKIFIDRNGLRFQYILDYMRDKKVHLPITIPKAALVKDLEYFGFHNVSPEAINGSYASFEAATHMAISEKTHQADLVVFDMEIHELEKKKRHAILAYDCFKYYSQTGSLTNIPFVLQVSKHREVSSAGDYHNACCVFNDFDEDLLDECLAKYGLYYVGYSASPPSERKVTVGALVNAVGRV
jgi:hypothetical protein